MGIEKMELINIYGKLSSLNYVLLKCCESNCFHIEPAIHSTQKIPGIRALNEENPYLTPLATIKSLANNLNISLEKTDYSAINFYSPEEFTNLAQNLNDTYKSVSTQLEKDKIELSQLEQLLDQIEHLWGLEVNFERIFACEHIKVRVGKIPVQSLSKLEYYDDTDLIFVPFKRNETYAWGMYFAPVSEGSMADYIMSTLYFERFRVPDFVTGTPETAFQKLIERKNELITSIKKDESELAEFFTKNKEVINKCYHKIKNLGEMFELRKNAAVLNDDFYLVGFVPREKSEMFKDFFDEAEDVTVTLKPPETDLALVPPTKLKNGFFSKPFTPLIEMYGMPGYKDINPTGLFAFLYCLLFGIMFGDIGQGLVIILIGLLMKHKMKNPTGGVLTRVGAFSTFFGFIYGSIFGFEHALDGFYKAIGLGHKPIEVFHETNLILISAIVIGILIIGISISLNIILGFRQKNYEKALFSNNGLAGFVFYMSLIIGLALDFAFGVKVMTAPYVVVFIVFPLVLMFFRVPFGNYIKYKKLKSEGGHHEGIGSFIAENFFELFEFLLSFVANTLSFLRVGGFVLSHSGMMLVVMTLSEMVAGTGSILVIIGGNAFVMALEGMVVAIQVMRLCYYEMFSRFYDANGKKFTPVGVTQ